MQIELSKQAIKFLKRLPEKQEKQVVRRIEVFAQSPRAPDTRKMSGSDCFRVDSGEYRIIYNVQSDTLFVWIVGKRKDNKENTKIKKKNKITRMYTKNKKEWRNARFFFFFIPCFLFFSHLSTQKVYRSVRYK